MTVLISPYSPEWPALFEAEAQKLKAAVSPTQIELHHIGSTSVPGLDAKPIIDIMGVAASLPEIDRYNAAIAALGYEVMGAFGMPGRRYYRKFGPDSVRSHHLHIFETGADHVTRHLAFRDYLRAHPRVADAYAALKHRLIEDGATDWDSYIDGKEAFVLRTEADALRWYAAAS